MNIENLEKTNCTGCHACVATCPKNCISMEMDELGFLYPVVDANHCIDCGHCVRICDRTKKIPVIEEQKIYAAKHSKQKVVEASSSGGVFTALSDRIFAINGVVVGSVFGPQFDVFHTFAVDETERDMMRGSKYTYSLCDETVFARVKELLQKKVPVLFTGTPCQVAAINTYLHKEYPDFYSVDLLCHGVESPNIYKDFIDSISKYGTVTNIDFRCPKENTWHLCKTKVDYKKRKSRFGARESAYFNMFTQDYALRTSCYTCQYAQFNRVSDITLGDFWGIENTDLKEFDNNAGVSVVIVNTKKGQSLFEQACKDMIIVRANVEDCTHHQLNGLSGKKDTTYFNEEYLTKGYAYVAKKYGMQPWNIRIREKLYDITFINKMRNMVKKLFVI